MAGKPEFAAVYDLYFDRVYNYARYRVSSAELADDITSRVFEQVLAKLDSFDPDHAPFEAWLFAIARNAVTDIFRAGRFTGDITEEAALMIPDSTPHVHDVLTAHEDRQTLLAALETLDARSREILALKFGAAMTNRDIAASCGLKETNVGIIVFRAVKLLKQKLSGEKEPVL